MSILARIAEQAIGRPLLLDPGKAEIILRVLDGRIGLDMSDAHWAEPEANRFIGSHRREARPYGLVKNANGVGILTISGTLVNRGAHIGASSGLVSYEGIAAQLMDAAADTEIRALIIDMDSPGGQANGMFDLAARVRSVAERKPVVTLVNDVAASAAYGLAAGSTEIVVSPSSIVGSIGVILVHMDHSAQLANQGVKPTIIHAGATKPDGHPAVALSDDAFGRLQSMVDAVYEQFLDVVELGRGAKLSRQQARATEARIFLGADAVKAGLADRVGTLDETIARLARGEGRLRLPSSAGANMTTNNPAAEQPTPPATTSVVVGTGGAGSGLTAAAPAAPVALVDAGAAATARIAAILDCEEAKTRPSLARHLALKTSTSAEQAIETLKAAASEQSQGLGYLASKQASQGLDLGLPQPAAGDSGWGKVTAEINRANGFQK